MQRPNRFTAAMLGLAVLGGAAHGRRPVGQGRAARRYTSLPLGRRDADAPISIDGTVAPWGNPMDLEVKAYNLTKTVTTVQIPDEVPAGFNAPVWQDVQRFIIRTEEQKAPQMWARFKSAYQRYAGFKGKGKAQAATAAKQAYFDWLYTQRFKFASIRPGMTAEQLWLNSSRAIYQDKIPWFMATNMDGLKEKQLHALGQMDTPPEMQPYRIDTRKAQRLLSTSEKTVKGKNLGVATMVMYMSPSTEAGINVCAGASAGCKAACLGFSTGRLTGTQQMTRRMHRTLYFTLFRRAFIEQLVQEINKGSKEAVLEGFQPALRLNGSSDIAWEQPQNGAIPQMFPQIQAYDYTKLPAHTRRLLPNYHLIYSYSEVRGSLQEALKWLKKGANVAIVVGQDGKRTQDSASNKGHQKSAKAFMAWANRRREGFLGHKIVYGDASDVRFRDPKGTWVVLYAKGTKAAQDTSGFVIRVTPKGVPIDPVLRGEAPIPSSTSSFFKFDPLAVVSKRDPSQERRRMRRFGVLNRKPTRRSRRKGRRDSDELMEWYDSSWNQDC